MDAPDTTRNETRTERCPRCEYTWDVLGLHEHGNWNPYNEDDLICEGCGNNLMEEEKVEKIEAGDRIRMKGIMPSATGAVHISLTSEVLGTGSFEGRDAACLKANNGCIEIYDIEDIRKVEHDDIYHHGLI